MVNNNVNAKLAAMLMKQSTPPKPNNASNLTRTWLKHLLILRGLLINGNH